MNIFIKKLLGNDNKDGFEMIVHINGTLCCSELEFYADFTVISFT